VERHFDIDLVVWLRENCGATVECTGPVSESVFCRDN